MGTPVPLCSARERSDCETRRSGLKADRQAVTEAAQHSVPTIGYRFSGGLTDSIVDGVTGLLVDDHDELVAGLERLLADHVLRDQLGAKAQARSGEFSWRQSAHAMRTVLESMYAGRRVSGVV